MQQYIGGVTQCSIPVEVNSPNSGLDIARKLTLLSPVEVNAPHSGLDLAPNLTLSGASGRDPNWDEPDAAHLTMSMPTLTS